MVGYGIPAIFGPLSENMKGDMEEYLKSTPSDTEEPSVPVVAVSPPLINPPGNVA